MPDLDSFKENQWARPGQRRRRMGRAFACFHMPGRAASIQQIEGDWIWRAYGVEEFILVFAGKRETRGGKRKSRRKDSDAARVPFYTHE